MIDSQRREARGWSQGPHSVPLRSTAPSWGAEWEPFLALVVLVSAALHPLWMALMKRDDRPERALLANMVFMGLIGGGHALLAGYDMMAVRHVWPWMVMSGGGWCFT